MAGASWRPRRGYSASSPEGTLAARPPSGGACAAPGRVVWAKLLRRRRREAPSGGFSEPPWPGAAAHGARSCLGAGVRRCAERRRQQGSGPACRERPSGGSKATGCGVTRSVCPGRVGEHLSEDAANVHQELKRFEEERYRVVQTGTEPSPRCLPDGEEAARQKQGALGGAGAGSGEGEAGRAGHPELGTLGFSQEERRTAPPAAAERMQEEAGPLGQARTQAG